MNHKKILAAKILKVSPQKVKFDVEALEEIGKALTRSDIRGLIAVGKITKVKGNEQSRGRARKTAAQKRKGRRKNEGSKKGNKYSKVSGKERWVTRVRLQRAFIRELRDKHLISPKDYLLLYSKIKGGFFRNKRHIKLYLNEYNLIQKPMLKQS
jgi:large subunit ribosomal protein L19e